MAVTQVGVNTDVQTNIFGQTAGGVRLRFYRLEDGYIVTNYHVIAYAASTAMTHRHAAGRFHISRQNHRF